MKKFLLLLLFGCTKEYSDSRVVQQPVYIAKTYWVYYSIPVEGNNELYNLVPMLKTKYRDWYDFTALPVVNDSTFMLYQDSLDCTDEMKSLLPGDTALLKFQLGWSDGSLTYTPITDTIIK